MLCTQLKNDVAVPAAWGTHHILRIKGFRLVIMRRPRKSISAGLACTATYSELECAKGRRRGFISCACPLETARRVDHASNVAAASEPATSAYHKSRVTMCSPA